MECSYRCASRGKFFPNFGQALFRRVSPCFVVVLPVLPFPGYVHLRVVGDELLSDHGGGGLGDFGDFFFICRGNAVRFSTGLLSETLLVLPVLAFRAESS